MRAVVSVKQSGEHVGRVALTLSPPEKIRSYSLQAAGSHPECGELRLPSHVTPHRYFLPCSLEPVGSIRASRPSAALSAGRSSGTGFQNQQVHIAAAFVHNCLNAADMLHENASLLPAFSWAGRPLTQRPPRQLPHSPSRSALLLLAAAHSLVP